MDEADQRLDIRLVKLCAVRDLCELEIFSGYKRIPRFSLWLLVICVFSQHGLEFFKADTATTLAAVRMVLDEDFPIVRGLRT